MNIIWFSWKDRWHPEAGGAETVSGEIMDRLARDGNNVYLITSSYPGANDQETKNGVNIIRGGNRYTVYVKAFLNHKRLFSDLKIDLVIDEMNTLPFWSGFYVKSQKKILLTYQLAKEVWFYQMKFPFSLIGYVLEPIMLFIIKYGYSQTVTESNSTKNDLKKYGFKNIKVFSIGMALSPIAKLINKKNNGVILSLGAIRPMKRTLHAIKAFEFARDTNQKLKLIVAGDNSTKYAKRVIDYVKNSRHYSAIDIKGRVTAIEKISLMQSSEIILVTSIKEGWGLIVTEANSQGTPAIVYDVDGLRDSVKNNITGILSPNNNPREMGLNINKLLSNKQKNKSLREKAWSCSKKFTFEDSYRDFIKKTINNANE